MAGGRRTPGVNFAGRLSLGIPRYKHAAASAA
jgi:hypothetical protein